MPTRPPLARRPFAAPGGGSARGRIRRVGAGGGLPPRARRAAALASAVLTAAACASQAAGAARGAAVTPVSLLPGDAVVVAGSKLNCIVSEAAGKPITLVCGEGPVGRPTPGTYAFALADTAALVLRSSTTGRPELVARVAQPSKLPGAFPRPSDRPPRMLRLAVGRVFDVAGTDIYCGVTTENRSPSVTCGLADPRTTFAVGGVAAFASSRTVFLSRLVAAGRFARLKTVAQPAR